MIGRTGRGLQAGPRLVLRMADVTDRVGEHDGGRDVIRFAWDAGGGGTLQVTWRDGAVAGLTVTFDA
jgi:hypothetical protein